MRDVQVSKSSKKSRSTGTHRFGFGHSDLREKFCGDAELLQGISRFRHSANNARVREVQFEDTQNGLLKMADREYSAYQQKVIQRYYDNKDAIDEQRLSELVTNLYLAPPKKQAKMWDTAKELMERMKITPSRIEHVINSRDVAVLAKVVEELQKGTLKRG